MSPFLWLIGQEWDERIKNSEKEGQLRGKTSPCTPGIDKLLAIYFSQILAV